MTTPELLIDGASDAPMTFAFAHGAGLSMTAPFMQTFAEGIAAMGFRVARFDFPYMVRAQETGKRRPPDRPPVLLGVWQDVIDALGRRDRLVIGGKSMGGRMASIKAAELEASGEAVAGLVCMGYPFHPPGKPEKLRVEHLGDLKTPTLICQGTRDPFGRNDEVPGYPLSPAIKLHWLEDGEHGFKPRRASGISEEQNHRSAINAIAEFMSGL